jgi:hypothetical protein
MDFGTYVSFRGTKNEPEQKVFWPLEDPKKEELELVPLDDRRSIRRIVVSQTVLDKYWSLLKE